VPVPADYDGDGKADLAVKSADGDWFIDFASNGFGHWDEPSPLHGYGDASAVPVPADYDGDGKADLAVKRADGDWFIDFASNGFGHWDQPSPFHGYGGDWTIATPGRYDPTNPGKSLDLSVKDKNGFWFIDRASSDYGAWDIVPGSTSTCIDNVNRPLVGTNAPRIDSTTIRDPRNFLEAPIENGQYKLEIGVRYTVEVHIALGEPPCAPYPAGLEMNPDLHVPTSLNLINPVGATNFIRIEAPHTRTFAITCSQFGSFPLGFMMRQIDLPTEPGDGLAINPDYGIRVTCTSQGPGLYGTVTVREPFASPDLYLKPDFRPGPAIEGATISVDSLTTKSDAEGYWSLPSVVGGPHRVTVSKAGRSSAIAVNVTVPAGSGMRVDTPLEEGFDALAHAGMSYTTYIDYSRGRTILHTLGINSFFASVKLKKTTPAGQDYERLWNLADAQRAPAIVNGCWWNYGPAKFVNTPDLSDDTADGYFFARSAPADRDRDAYRVSVPDDDRGIFYYAEPPPTVLQPAFTHPMLAISGTGAHQNIGIVQTESNFLSPTSTQWSQVHDSNPSVTETFPLWDAAPRDEKSDVDYAVQCWPNLLVNGAVIARGQFTSDPGDIDYAFPRTAIGVRPGTRSLPSTSVYLVVADGEGVNGGNGATFNQLGEFFRDVLGATAAMNLDGGESSEMVLRGASGPRIINRLSSENHAAAPRIINGLSNNNNVVQGGYVPSGAVFNYFVIGEGSVVQP
jgi:hypothetical protein